MPIILIEDIEKDKEKFLEIHGKGLYLGSSEIATAAGLNKFQTPLQLWMRKTGRDTSVIDNKFTRRGKLLERSVADIFLDEHPEFYKADKINTTYRDYNVPWATCTPDFCLHSADFDGQQPAYWVWGAERVLEVKTSGIWARKLWAQGVPDFVRIQMQWQMGILGISQGYAGGLIGGEPMFPPVVEFNKDIFDQLLELGDRFLTFVKSDTPPTARFDDDLSNIKPVEKSIELPDQIGFKIGYFVGKSLLIAEKNAELRILEQERDGAKNEIIQAMGDANLGKFGDYRAIRKIVPIKASNRKAYDQIRFTIIDSRNINKDDDE